jgi:hypothetical protein
MDENSFGGFVPFPLSSLLGNLQSLQQRAEEAPARVRVAIACLRDFTHKTASVVAGNSISLEEFAGQVLGQGEKEVQASACKMLADYFSGTLKPTEQEKLERVPLGSKDSPGMVLRCFVCDHRCSQERAIHYHPFEDCVVCKGRGNILCFPA